MTHLEKASSYLNSNKAPIGMFVLAIAVGLGATSHIPIDNSNGNPAEIDADAPGWVTQEVEVYQKRDIDNDGEREVYRQLAEEKKNLLVEQGQDFYAAKVAGTSFPAGADLFSNATYIALSNESSPQAADVGLQGEFTTGGLERGNCRGTNGEYIDLGIGNYSCAVTFTATSRFDNVNMTGLMWNGTQASDSLVAEVSFPPATILPDDQLVANWTEISFSEAP